ncbi:MAG: 5-(carboxyamino)imidazole ribonucleotide mutase, partial [Bacillota bacterium]
EVAVASAHRTPERVQRWASTAAGRGLKVIIAGAGGAAHLPGVIAAWTPLPVIGVPIAASLEGLDALLSIAQMPPGVPVAAVGVNGARNAALLAAEILALSDPALAERLQAFRREQGEKVAERERRLLAALESNASGAGGDAR